MAMRSDRSDAHNVSYDVKTKAFQANLRSRSDRATLIVDGGIVRSTVARWIFEPATGDFGTAPNKCPTMPNQTSSDDSSAYRFQLDLETLLRHG